tara:strand:+ start:1179 stop:1427 length:249 start_codon:yes stop_codon:yes gene_type:complete
MEDLIKKLIETISDIHDRQAQHSTEILKSRYEVLELLKIMKENDLITTEDIGRIYKKGEQYEQSSNESRGSTGDIHQSVSKD